jgi:hypothetical protein
MHVAEHGQISTLAGSLITLGVSAVLAGASYSWFKYMPRYYAWISDRFRSYGCQAGRGSMSNSSRHFGGYFLLLAAVATFVLSIVGIITSA